MDGFSGLRIGIDLGGTKTAAVVLRGDTAIWHHRSATPASSYRDLVAALGDLVERAEQAVGTGATVGIGTPGALDPHSGTIKNANTTVLNGQPFGRDLEARLGRKVRLANDANCLIASEAADGSAGGASVAFGAILGTGVGGGIAIGGRPLPGAHAIAGEWGHNPLPWPNADEASGPSCYCGRSGCIETYLSGPGLSADHRRITGIVASAEAIAAAAETGDAAAQATIERYCDRLARGLATVINLIDPDAIVLGGGLSQIAAIYRRVPQLWGQYVFQPEPPTTPLRPPRHGDASGVRGAARLWDDDRVIRS